MPNISRSKGNQIIKFAGKLYTKYGAVVHELEPKKLIFGSGGWTELSESVVLSSYELSESVVFSQKLRYFTDQNGPKVGPHENEF